MGTGALQIGAVLVVACIVGTLFRKIRQPQVVGEMVAGIMLGPSLLGWAPPGLFNALFPAASLGYLHALSQVGLVLFMFLIGVFLNPAELRNLGYAALLTSHMSIVHSFLDGRAFLMGAIMPKSPEFPTPDDCPFRCRLLSTDLQSWRVAI